MIRTANRYLEENFTRASNNVYNVDVLHLKISADMADFCYHQENESVHVNLVVAVSFTEHLTEK